MQILQPPPLLVQLCSILLQVLLGLGVQQLGGSQLLSAADLLDVPLSPQPLHVPLADSCTPGALGPQLLKQLPLCNCVDGLVEGVQQLGNA